MKEGITGTEVLAKQANCNFLLLEIIMRSLADRGVFTQVEPGYFKLNETSEQFFDPLAKLMFDLEGIGGRFAKIWGTLLEFVKTGNSQYQNVFGIPFWEDLEQNLKIANGFDDLIGPLGHANPDVNFEISNTWNDIKTVVDVGGGTGYFLANLLTKHKHLNGVLVDLPRTASKAGSILKEFNVSDRLKIRGQNFFDPLPEGADIYILRGIINDFPDDQAVELLKVCHEALSINSSVIIIGHVLTDKSPRSIPHETILADGKMRTVEECITLIEKADLNVVNISKQSDMRHVIECRLTEP